jgi:hypothetical protein
VAARVQTRIESRGAAGQIERGAKAQATDEMLEWFGMALLHSIFGDQDGSGRAGEKQQDEEQERASGLHRSGLSAVDTFISPQQMQRAQRKSSRTES